MRFNVLQDPDEFAGRVRDFLVANEAEHSLLFGIIANLADGWSYEATSGEGQVLALVEDHAGVQVVGVLTPPRNLVISRAPTVGAVEALAGGLSALSLPLPGVSGPAAESLVFALCWARLHASTFRRAMAMQLHRASRIRDPLHPAPGRLRPAGLDDEELVAQWIADFNDEALEAAVTDRAAARRMAKDLVSHRGRSVYLWEDGHPVSMAATGYPSPNAGRVYAVYTPPEHRRKGYAGSSVAALSRSILARGLTWCCLFADLTNPTAQRIYHEIGYEPVALFDDYRFGA